MTNSITLSRAVAQATAVLGVCLLACALQGAFACPATAFTPAPASAKTGGENTPINLGPSSTASHSSSSGGASLVRTIVGLAIVIAVIWGLTWILRQVKAAREGGGREGGRDSRNSNAGLSSVAALTLGSGRSVHLVRAGSDYVLLGSTEHGVAPIHRYTEQQAREAGLLPDLSAGSDAGAGSGAGAGSDASAPAPERSRVRVSARQASPVTGERPDPMRMPSPSANLIERLRELTVRR
jgi:flagellar protein FliO/FliZ